MNGSCICVAFVAFNGFVVGVRDSMITQRQNRLSSRFAPAAFSSGKMESVTGLMELFRRETRRPPLWTKPAAAPSFHGRFMKCSSAWLPRCRRAR